MEKNGRKVPKIYFSKAGGLQNTSPISRWSPIGKILSCISANKFRDTDYLNSAFEILKCMGCFDCPIVSFFNLSYNDSPALQTDVVLTKICTFSLKNCTIFYQLHIEGCEILDQLFLPRIKLIKQLLSTASTIKI